MKRCVKVERIIKYLIYLHMKLLSYICISLLLAVNLYNTVSAIKEDEDQAIKEAVLDYIEGLYYMEPERIERSIHPDLSKRGLRKTGDDTDYEPHIMSYDILLEAAETANIDGRIPDDAPRDIQILDQSDKTASVRLISFWGVEYIQLKKDNGKWQIIHILWQSIPEDERE